MGRETYQAIPGCCQSAQQGLPRQGPEAGRHGGRLRLCLSAGGATARGKTSDNLPLRTHDGVFPKSTKKLRNLPLRSYSSDIAFTPAVKAIQTEKGSRSSYSRMEKGGSWETTVTPELEAFLSDLDMFYLGTANAEGQPYIQYRGGSPGFLKVVDEKTLGF